MSRIKDLLYGYIYSKSVDIEFLLAEQYFLEQQYAIASTFYLKVAENSTDKNLQYYSLIKCGKCYDIPGNRKHSVMTLYKHAIHLLPQRQEAYHYLSLVYEKHNDWYDCYTFANIALEKSFQKDEYSDKLEYYGEYMPLFQKAISAWHIGKGSESRYLLQKLIDEHYNQLGPVYIKTIFNNIKTLGSGPDSVSYVPYYVGNNRLKFLFNNWHTIQQNYSQVLQDIFVLTALNGKENGTYLEIGSGDPTYGNNTYLLESKFNWTGIGLEINSTLCEKYNSARTNKSICVNALEVDYNEILDKISVDGVVDYLQLDCEPSNVTYDIMTLIPFDKYKFGIITYEHDHYLDISRQYRNLSRKFLEKQGYVLVVNDISADGVCSFEDWWIHPELINEETIKKLTNNDLSTIKNVKEYMYG